MNTRAFIHDPEELLKEGTSIINSSSDAKYVLRVALVNFMLAKTASAEELSLKLSILLYTFLTPNFLSSHTHL